ncbi:hypothetical protein B0H11DRAFT_2261189 [Mycena galericulata]|nr:hypothetical protein B0H11DRAFT_2261189 [Mycena galericulata]
MASCPGNGARFKLAYIEYSMGRLQLHPDPEAPLEQTMQRLDIRRRKLLEPLTAYRDPFYFGSNLRTRFRWFTLDEGSALDVRLVLSSVCSKWRSVALATHEIWNDVDVIFTRANTTRRLKALDEIWFPRSGEYPLTLRFSLREEDSRITERLIRYAHRCRFLSIGGLHCLGAFLNSCRSLPLVLSTSSWCWMSASSARCAEGVPAENHAWHQFKWPQSSQMMLIDAFFGRYRESAEGRIILPQSLTRSG